LSRILTYSVLHFICSLLLLTLGKQINMEEVVVGLEETIRVETRATHRYGTAGHGPNLFQEIWKNERHIFNAGGEKMGLGPGVCHLGHPDRAAANTLNQLPVEVLAIDESTHTGPLHSTDRYWVRWMDRCERANQPKYVLVATSPQELVADDGLQTKSWRRRFDKWGYEAHYWFLRSHEHGGVVRQDRCVLILHRREEGEASVRVPQVVNPDQARRTAHNMLTPVGIPRRAWVSEEWTPRVDYPDWIVEAAAPCVVAGETNERRLPVFSTDGCLPDTTNVLISTSKGLRRLLQEELARAKGVPESWIKDGRMKTRWVNEMTDIHIWAAVGAGLYPSLETGTEETWSIPADRLSPIGAPRKSEEPHEEWEWSPPDLQKGGTWYNERVKTLAAATHDLPNGAQHFAEGLKALDIHRSNYEGEGDIQQLQILWWEFPREHWTVLREGSPMNFLTPPPPQDNTERSHDGRAGGDCG
jgi:hypothetical protein